MAAKAPIAPDPAQFGAVRATSFAYWPDKSCTTHTGSQFGCTVVAVEFKAHVAIATVEFPRKDGATIELSVQHVCIAEPGASREESGRECLRALRDKIMDAGRRAVGCHGMPKSVTFDAVLC
jgi:hypothetical protein